MMNSYEIKVEYRDANGILKGKAKFRVDAANEEAAKVKLEAVLKDDQPHKIVGVKQQ